MKKALFSGSFDPVTLAHQWLIEQSLEIFDHLTVLVSINPVKKTHFSLDKRLDFINKVCAHNLKKKLVFIDSSDLLTVNYAKNHDIKFLIRGIRNAHDYIYEQNLQLINYNLRKDVKTIFIPSSSNMSYHSSSLVKELLSHGNLTDEYVDHRILSDLKNQYHK